MEPSNLDYGGNIAIGIKIPIGGLLFFIESDGLGSAKEVIEDGNNLTNQTIGRNTLSIGIVF